MADPGGTVDPVDDAYQQLIHRALNRPTHLLANVGDRNALCGVKDPLPFVWEPFVQAHVKGHNMVVCADCAAHSGRPISEEKP